MKTLEELGQYYNGQLLADLQDLETDRKKVKSRVIPVYAMGILLSLACLAMPVGLPGHPGTWITMVSAWVWILVAVFIVKYYVARSYVKAFKGRVISKLVSFIDLGLQYSPEKRLDRSAFESSKIFRGNANLYSGSDYVSGKVGKTSIEFSEVLAQDESRDSDGEHVHTIFRGVFFAADFNKNFNGVTVVIPDIAKHALGDFLGGLEQSMSSGRGGLVKLEDPEFDREFVVYSTDQVEARYVLSTSLMQRILNYKKTSNEKIYLSFVGNKIYVAISKLGDPFQPHIFGTLLDFGQVVEYYERLKVITRIVDDLHLNTRIWNKEVA